MQGRRVTVFGGSGFVGRYVVKRLAAKGARVRVAVRDIEAAKFLKPMGAVGQIAPVAVNVGDGASVAAAVEGAEIVVNTVGILYESGRQTFQRAHVDGPKAMAEAAAQTGAQAFVHVSAIGADPATCFASVVPAPPDIDELLIAGFLRKKPVWSPKGPSRRSSFGST